MSYRSVLKNHVLDDLGDIRLADLTTERVSDHLAALGRQRSTRHPDARVNGVAPNVVIVLRSMLNAAVKAKAGALETFDFPKAPKHRRVRPEDEQGDVARPEEVKAFAEAMPAHLRIAVPLAAWCALRIGEVLRRHSNRGPTEERLEKAHLVAERERRPKPWSPTKTPGPSRWRNMSTDEWRAMVTRYQGGSTAKEVAARFEVSESALLTRLQALGVVRPNAKVTRAQVAEMAALREQGLTYREIGERYGITRRAVSTRLDAENHHQSG